MKIKRKKLHAHNSFLVSILGILSDLNFRVLAAGKSLVALNDVHLLSPVTKPDKIACVGLNYTGHCDEQNKPYPKEPIIFSKWSSVITGPNDNVVLPSISSVSLFKCQLQNELPTKS